MRDEGQQRNVAMAFLVTALVALASLASTTAAGAAAGGDLGWSRRPGTRTAAVRTAAESARRCERPIGRWLDGASVGRALERCRSADLLIHAGADANTANDFRMTPLSLACTNGSAAFVELLLKAGANPNTPIATGETPIMTCASSGSADAVRMLIARGADVNAKEPSQNQTALMWAAAEHHPNVVRTLIEAQADLQAHTKKGFTALHFAAREGDLESTRLLLAAGVNVNIRSQPEPRRRPKRAGAAAPTDRRRARRRRRGGPAYQAALLPAARRCWSPPSGPSAARALPAGARRGSQCRRAGLYPPALGGDHLGKWRLEPGVRFRRPDERDSGSAGQAAAREGPSGAWRGSECAHDAAAARIRRRLHGRGRRDAVPAGQLGRRCRDDAAPAGRRSRSQTGHRDQHDEPDGGGRPQSWNLAKAPSPRRRPSKLSGFCWTWASRPAGSPPSTRTRFSARTSPPTSPRTASTSSARSSTR